MSGVPQAGADRAAVPPGRVWTLGLGFVIWCFALSFLYGIHAIGCAFAWPPTVLRWVLVIVLALHCAALAGLWLRERRNPPDPEQGATGAFMHWAIVGTLIAALVSAVLALGAPLLLHTCV